MRKSKSPAQSFSRKVFAGVFVLLVVIQAIGSFYFNPPSASAGRVARVASDAAELCERAGENGAHTENSCSHVGFCVFCSAQGRSHAAFAAPPLRLDYFTIVFEEPEEAPPLVFAALVPPPTTGWKVTWSATAPPRV